jgi:hypothetical protein
MIRFATLWLLLLAGQASAQARVASSPAEPSLLNLTAGWARASSIGDLRELRVNGDHLELRVWHGYSQAETQATVVRRVDGHWSASLARVIRCEIRISREAADTASRATMRGFVAEARRNCGRSVVDATPGSRLIASDTLFVQPILVPETGIQAAWDAARDAGVLELPPRVKHDRERDDGLSFLIELRQGNTYRATELGDVDPPQTKDDERVKQIYSAVRRLLTSMAPPPEQR